MKIKIPAEAAKIIAALEQGGYESYVVGGCVRDSLLGQAPQDWDICSSATPRQAMKCLREYRITAVGLTHGTITVMAAGQTYEVTAFRSDGVYSDHRHPDRVEFVSSLRKDLARRDFTVNAMAYHPTRGLIDYYGGAADLAARLIRAVGDADTRFREDGLRIMRALRFASTLDFFIEPATAASVIRNKGLLRHIAAERLNVELVKLLAGPGNTAVLAGFAEVIGVFIPQLMPMLGFEQHSPYHHLDVWQHTLAALDNAPADIAVRLALLFHDIGKPCRYSLGADGIGHFYGHAQAGSEITAAIMHRLRFDSRTADTVRELVLYHSVELPPQEKAAKYWLNKLGEEQLRRLLELKKADALAHRLDTQAQKVQRIEGFSACVDAVLSLKQCFNLQGLAVNGRDIIQLGVPQGAVVGRILDKLLHMVIAGQTPNEKEALLEAALKIAEVMRGEGEPEKP